MFPVPSLTTSGAGLYSAIEKSILRQVSTIESWFRLKWLETPAPITTSVDLRHAGFKLAPVDTNLFPAGFNNLNPDFLPLCIQAIQAEFIEYNPHCKRILIIPESHTRNQFYFQSLSVLKNIISQAGFEVRLGSVDPQRSEPLEISIEGGEQLLIEPLIKTGSKISVSQFDPCLVLLNNDLSSGIPPVLQSIQQKIEPNPKLGWSTRLKSTHFKYYDEVISSFCKEINLDPWLINPYFSSVQDVDFMAQAGLDKASEEVHQLLTKIKKQYAIYGIKEKPFVVMKAENGTYGMSVMMVHDAEELRSLNRKARNRMSTSKGGQKVDKYILQEGVYSFETMQDGAVAEPVVYMIGQFVVGGFYRVHKEKGPNENLNSPGMHFEPLAFAEPCNMPREKLDCIEPLNRFYVYGVIARLAAMAAAREIAALVDE